MADQKQQEKSQDITINVSYFQRLYCLKTSVN